MRGKKRVGTLTGRGRNASGHGDRERNIEAPSLGKASSRDLASGRKGEEGLNDRPWSLESIIGGGSFDLIGTKLSPSQSLKKEEDIGQPEGDLPD